MVIITPIVIAFPITEYAATTKIASWANCVMKEVPEDICKALNKVFKDTLFILAYKVIL